MRICYLLASTDLSGGVRVVLDQARALRARGHEVKVLSLAGDPRWYPYPVEVMPVRAFSDAAGGWDVAVGTFWATVADAARMGAELTVHLCQGFEWTFPEYAPIRGEIEEMYALPIPKLVIGGWLQTQLQERFGSDAFPIHNVGQSVDTVLFSPPPWRQRWYRAWRGLAIPRAPLRVLVSGIYQSWFKGIGVALDAVEKTRREGVPIHLTRISSVPYAAEEDTHTHIDAYHHSLPPLQVAAHYRQAELLIAPSRAPEGFGLPFAEALASGLPVIATKIPSYLSLDARHDYAWFVDQDDSDGMAQGLKQLWRQPRLRRRLGRRGRAVMEERFSAAAVAERLEQIFADYLTANERE